MKTLAQESEEALAIVTEARFKIKEALATANLADAQWWEKELKTRVNYWRSCCQREEWAKIPWNSTPEAGQ